MRKNLLVYITVALFISMGLLSCGVTESATRAKTPIVSIQGSFSWVKYQATKNGKVVIDHNEGNMGIAVVENGARFEFFTYQYNLGGYVQVPEPGMVFSLYNEEPVPIGGKPYDVKFEATVPTTVQFYTEVPQPINTVRKIENVPVTFKGWMKEIFTSEFRTDYNSDIEIRFEVDGDAYVFTITRLSPWKIIDDDE